MAGVENLGDQVWFVCFCFFPDTPFLAHDGPISLSLFLPILK